MSTTLVVVFLSCVVAQHDTHAQSHDRKPASTQASDVADDDAAGDDVATDDNKPAKNFRSVFEACKAMPKKPCDGDNYLAARENKSWIENNIIGHELRFVGVISLVPAVAGSGSRTFVKVLTDRQKKCFVWNGCEFSVSCEVHFDEHPPTDLSKVQVGDAITVDGKIASFRADWKTASDKGIKEGKPALSGSVDVIVEHCSLVSLKHGGKKQQKQQAPKKNQKKPNAQNK